MFGPAFLLYRNAHTAAPIHDEAPRIVGGLGDSYSRRGDRDDLFLRFSKDPSPCRERIDYMVITRDPERLGELGGTVAEFLYLPTPPALLHQVYSTERLQGLD